MTVSALVVGVGQRDRGDDAVGLLVADEVRRLAADVSVVTVASPTRLIDVWEGWEAVVVVDAVRSGRAVGSVSVVTVASAALPVRAGAGGTHGFGVTEAVELARTLGRLPSRLVVVGVEAASFAVGAEVTPAVRAAVGEAAASVVEAVGAASGRRPT